MLRQETASNMHATYVNGVYTVPMSKINPATKNAMLVDSHTDAPYSLMRHLEEEDRVVLPPPFGFSMFGVPEDRTPNHGDLAEGMIQSPDVNPYPNQSDAIETVVAALRRPPYRGVLSAPCGTGKTEMGLFIACRRQRACAIVVHRSELLRQWRARINKVVPGATIGVVQGRKDQRGKDFCLIMMQTLIRRYDASHFERFGTVFFDECHHVPARTFFQSSTVLYGPNCGTECDPEADGWQDASHHHAARSNHCEYAENYHWWGA